MDGPGGEIDDAWLPKVAQAARHRIRVSFEVLARPSALAGREVGASLLWRRGRGLESGTQVRYSLPDRRIARN